MIQPEVYKASNNIRIITATSLFDGHDATINIIRRIIQSTGGEVIHLGHNKSVDEIVGIVNVGPIPQIIAPGCAGVKNAV